ENQRRYTGAISLQFKPWDGTLFTVDALAAQFEVERTESNLEAPSFGTGGACLTGTGASPATANNANSSCALAQTTMTSGTIFDPGFSNFSSLPPAAKTLTPVGSATLVPGKDIWQITAGTFNNVDVRSEQRYDQYHTRFNQVTLRFEQKIT